jgi:hypothetical protein
VRRETSFPAYPARQETTAAASNGFSSGLEHQNNHDTGSKRLTVIFAAYLGPNSQSMQKTIEGVVRIGAKTVQNMMKTVSAEKDAF